MSKGERCPSARGTEALQSCFCRPGLPSMTTGSRESWRSTSRRRGARCGGCSPPRAAGILALAKKKAKKNRGGDITPIRLRRKLRRQPRPARPLAASPARPSRPSPADPAGPAAVCQAAAPETRSCCRKEPHGMRGRCGRTSFGPGAGRARLGRKSCIGMAVRFAVGAQESQHHKPPPGSPRPPPSHCFPARYFPPLSAHFCPLLPGIARNCPELLGKKILPLSKCPRTVRRSRSASRRAPLAAAPVALRAPFAAANAK